ncbi:hypothetical protein BDR26DRAFT_858296, partial [Obelidium mucronatum]
MSSPTSEHSSLDRSLHESSSRANLLRSHAEAMELHTVGIAEDPVARPLLGHPPGSPLSFLPDEDFQTRTIRPVFVNEAPSIASVEVTTPSIVASLHLRYNHESNEFFDEEMPVEMEGLIPNFVYTSRIKAINKRLSQFSTLKDFMSPARTTIFICFIIFSILFVLLASQFSAILLWCVSFAGLGIMFGALMYTYYKPGYERFIEAELESFTLQDDSIQLIWSSLRNHEQPMFTCDWSKKASEVPWRIIVTYINKQGAEAQFLPAYAPSMGGQSGLLLASRESIWLNAPPNPSATHSVTIPLNLDGNNRSITQVSRPPSYKSFL